MSVPPLAAPAAPLPNATADAATGAPASRSTPRDRPVPTPARRPPRRFANALKRRPGDVFLVDLDAFYVSVERARDPALCARPVIVGGKPGERGVVACASYEARAAGIRAGMPLFQAAALAPQGTVFLHGDHAAYLDASHRVMDLLARFSPRVEPVSLDEAYLDMAGLERHHRSWLEAGMTIRRAVREEAGLPISVGIGATRSVARIAAALAKPGGVMEVTRGEERAFLAALPLERLPGVGPRMRRELARFNLHTVGDLAEVPEALLEETFGRVGVALSRRARGVEAPEDEAAVGETCPKTRSISRETSFARDTADPRFVDGTLSYLAQRALRTLRTEGLLARAVGVKIRYADFRTVEARTRLAPPTDHDDAIVPLCLALWRKRYDRRVKLRLVGVVLHDLVPAGDRQLALAFPAARGDGASLARDACAPKSEAALQRLEQAVDAVRDRHGFGALVRGRAIDLLRRLPRAKDGFRLHTPSCSR